jgi:hypothetical protein
MDFLLLGRELPAFNLCIDAGSPPSLRCDHKGVVRLRKGWYDRLETLRWIDVLLEDVEGEAMHTAYDLMIQRFADLLGKDYPIQRRFFQRYVQRQEYQYLVPGTPTKDIEGLLEEPALLPFVWMNWLPGLLSGTPSISLAPFRVDFAMIVEHRRVVIEFDDLSEFMGYDLDPQWRGMGTRLCPERFTLYLRQDRWLRRDNWEVFRFSRSEVETEPMEVFIADLGL